MKRTEILTIVLIAAAAALLTFLVVNALLGGKIKQSTTIEEVEEIDRQLAKPTHRIFNLRAINPTVEVYVENQNPDESPTE